MSGLRTSGASSPGATSPTARTPSGLRPAAAAAAAAGAPPPRPKATGTPSTASSGSSGSVSPASSSSPSASAASSRIIPAADAPASAAAAATTTTTATAATPTALPPTASTSSAGGSTAASSAEAGLGPVVQTRPASETVSMRYSISALVNLIRRQEKDKGDQLEKLQKQLYDLKHEIAMQSKKNFTLEREIRNLDQKIALLIRNRITLDEVMAVNNEMSLINRTITLGSKREREQYGVLFWLLQNRTRYIATLARLVKLSEIDNLLQTVMFTLYGNQYDESEEHLLLTMFQEVLRDDYQQANSIGNLLRANTALTRMMTTYTRRGPGQQYLKQTLAAVLAEITSQPDLVLEINPLKVYDAYITQLETSTGKSTTLNRKPTPEEAAANEQVKAITAPRIKRLGELTDRFIDGLIASVAAVPYGIRWISKQIRELTREKFGDVATRQQTCSLIGGFFLLRFTNPAIVTPQAFMLVDQKMSPNTRRNLTLLAKVLQNLSNNQTFGGKEFYMAPLNATLARNQDRINQFLEELTRVEPLSHHTSLDKYIALGRTAEPFINISLNELYFIHGLLVQHRDEVCPKTADDLMRRTLDDMPPPPAQLARKDNANVDLKLVMPDGVQDVAEELTPEQIYAETKYFMFVVIKALASSSSSSNRPLAAPTDDLQATLTAAAEHAAASGNAELLQTVETIRANCARLVTAGLVSPTDNYAVLMKDVAQELLHYGNEARRRGEDTERLAAVLRAQQEHFKFLNSQLDLFKVYLENVRGKATVPTKPSGKKGSSSSSSSAAAAAASEQKPPALTTTTTAAASSPSATASTASAAAAGKKPAASSPSGGKAKTVKVTHSQLEKDGIIMHSEVPDDRKSGIVFCFSPASTPAEYDVLVLFKTRNIGEMHLRMEELLQKQADGQLTLDTDFLKLNINLLIFLLNNSFS